MSKQKRDFRGMLEAALNFRGRPFTRAQHILSIIKSAPAEERPKLLQYVIERYHLVGTSTSDTLMADASIPEEFEEHLFRGGAESLPKMARPLEMMGDNVDPGEVAVVMWEVLEGLNQALQQQALLAVVLNMDCLPYAQIPPVDEEMVEGKHREVMAGIRRECADVNAIFARGDFPGTFTDHAAKVIRLLEGVEDQEKKVALLGYAFRRSMWMIMRMVLGKATGANGADSIKHFLIRTFMLLWWRGYNHDE